MSGVLVVREAHSADKAARCELVYESVYEYFSEAFILFVVHELVLEGMLLTGAVLFIFAGAGFVACAALVPMFGALVMIAVLVAHFSAAERQVQIISQEEVGFVVEYRGPLFQKPPPRSQPLPLVQLKDDHGSHVYRKIVGTVCLSRSRDGGHFAWLHGLAVDPLWRCRGCGQALALAAQRAADVRGRAALHAALSTLHAPARRLLHALGWECAGSYARPLLGSVVTLQMARFRLPMRYD